jgi:mannose-6-phosphate isomerase-like protein (cupin superfamily)
LLLGPCRDHIPISEYVNRDSAGVGFATVIVCDSFVIAEWSDEGSTSRERPIAGLHVHRSDDEAWYVLAGRLGFRIGEEEREIGAGEWILVQRGTPHAYWNAISEPTRYLLVMTPRIHQLIVVLHSGERHDWARIFEEHDSELLT